MGLHSILCSGLQTTHLFCIRVCFGRSRSFRVIQGRRLWYQSKARMQIPISPSLWLWSYLALFLRYGDLLAKIAYFSYPSLIWRPMFPLKFRADVKRQKTRVMGLSSSEDPMIVAGVVLAWYQRVTDRRLDGQTESIIAKTALCIASYADALSKM